MESCNVNYIPPDNGKNEAIIAKITTTKLQKNYDDVKYSYFKPKDLANPRMKNQRILVAEAGEMTYAGKNFGPSCLKNTNLSRYYIGILDTISGEMKIANAHLFNLRPYKTDLHQEEMEEVDNDKSLMSYREKNIRLTQEYGIKKKKRALNAYLKTADDDDIVKDIVETTVETAQIDEERDKIVSLSSGDTVLPSANMNASHPSEVYNFNDLISEEEFTLLLAPASEFLNASKKQITQWSKEQILPKYIIEHLSVMPKSDTKYAQILVYLSYLFILFDKNVRNKNDRFPDNIPHIIKRNLNNRYTVITKSTKKPSRTVPQRLKDKLAIQILLLCLIIDDYNVDLIQLQRDLVMDLSKLVVFARVLLCTVMTKKINDENRTIACLRIPLPIPTVKRLKLGIKKR